MESRWSDEDARRVVDAYADEGVPADLATRVYTTRLLGQDPRLVLHGGGNTSLKTDWHDLTGTSVPVLHVKGSGWDMGEIEPAGLPAVRLEPLARLRALENLSDEEMVNQLRANLVDSTSPNPSVETLLHAYIPQRYVDHTHANAVLALTNRPDGERVCRDVFGDRVGIVPYIMPGFDLARAAADAYDRAPETEGLVLLKHGIFSWGDSARQSYERMISLVSAAEEWLADQADGRPAAVRSSTRNAPLSIVAPVLRGALASADPSDESDWRRVVVAFRTSDAIRRYVDGDDLERYSQAGPVTPDHVIRTKPCPLLLPLTEDLDELAGAATEAVAQYRSAYDEYFSRNDKRVGGGRTQLDSTPRVVLVPGLGLFASGRSAKDAGIAADLAETTVEVISDVERTARFESISEAEIFDMEYWSLEQAKLGSRVEPELAGHVVLITGGAGTIGRATAQAFKSLGAEVALLDTDDRAQDAARDVAGIGLACDVTDRDSIDLALEQVARAYGGVDIVVSNAGAAWQGRIGDIEDETLRTSFELNFFAHQHVAQAATAIMRRQGTGGVLLFNASKQALNPGPDFGPYGIPKTATVALARQYAIDHAADGIRSNVVNADRIRSGLLTDQMIAQRATARGVDENEYMCGNLLGREVRALDVAQAFVDLARARRTTGAILTVDGGNIAAAVR